jgi:hypothetical protein
MEFSSTSTVKLFKIKATRPSAALKSGVFLDEIEIPDESIRRCFLVHWFSRLYLQLLTKHIFKWDKYFQMQKIDVKWHKWFLWRSGKESPCETVSS